jgi:hypothetical protein
MKTNKKNQKKIKEELMVKSRSKTLEKTKAIFKRVDDWRKKKSEKREKRRKLNVKQSKAIKIKKSS